MPRSKAAPQHLNEQTQTRLRWSSLDNGESSQTVLDDSTISIEDDEPPVKRLRRSRRKRLQHVDEKLSKLLSQCHFYVNISNCDIIPRDSWICRLGSFDIVLKPVEEDVERLLNEHEQCWLYTGEMLDSCFLYFETVVDNCTKNAYFFVDEIPPYDFLSNLQATTANKNKNFLLRRTSYDSEKRILSVDVLLRNGGTAVVEYPSENLKLSNRDMTAVMKHFYGISLSDYSGVEKHKHHDVNVLFEAVKKYHHENAIDVDVEVQNAFLIPVLRQYQRNAVQWMLKQEIIDSNVQTDLLHELYDHIKSADGVDLYYNKYGDFIVLERPIQMPRKPGGILADEMGLGKTVEVLACVLCNPRSSIVGETSSSASELNGSKIVVENGISVVNVNGDDEITTDVSSENENLDDKRNRETSRLMDSLSVKVVSRPFFECLCGETDDSMREFNGDKVQCEGCGLWQHEDCVGYEQKLGPYYCPHCWILKPPISSGATLIVSPTSIRMQWMDEIKKHVKENGLRVYVYRGIYRCGFIQPRVLAGYDIVLTSYETLRKEIDYVDLPHSNSETGRRFRHPKRFMAVPSPLVAVEWWRICLDEAQMVECTTTKTAEMALRLHSINKWCVTGTPVQKSIEDLQGLLMFLGVDPYWVKKWWKECLYEPYCCGDKEPLHAVISKYLWRTCKKDVIDQINLPPQTEQIHWLRFTPVEEHFYKQQYLECSFEAVRQFNKVLDLDMTLSSIDRKTLNQLLAPLLRLRQACCHPQAVRGQFMTFNKNALTMGELLQSLIKKTKLDAEEAQRLHIFSLNGLAALHIINEQWVEASERYREVLRLAEEHSNQIKTDRLQRLHALHNLAELLEAGHTNIPPTLRDSSLRTEAETLRNEYLTKCAMKVTRSQENLVKAQQLVGDVKKQFSSDKWWCSVLESAITLGKSDELILRIQNDLTAKSEFRTADSIRFRTINGLKYIIVDRLDSLEESHSKLSKAVTELRPNPNHDEVNAAVECHLRPVERRPKRCCYCDIHGLFNVYEAKLFNFKKADEKSHLEPASHEDAMQNIRRGTWANSEVEYILRTILSFAKMHAAHSTVIEDANVQLKLFEALKQEFRGLRAVWMQIRDQVSALDELNMATIRMRLRLIDEPVLEQQQMNILEPAEVEPHHMKLLSDCVIAIDDKRKKIGQLLYLQNLAKSDYSKRGGSNPDPCAVCRHILGEQWSVLQCGHCYCVECIRLLMKHNGCVRLCSIKCPTCRQLTRPDEISYVNTKSEETDEVQQIEVKGSYSTKIEGITRTLLQIKQTEPDAKVLVFSTWQSVLDVLSKALVDNDITFRNLMTSTKYQETIANFKTNESIMCLLMLVHAGANGLNLFEATHVLLIEPILNPASELQAIGRVHRIGQTKPTKVHHFLVRGTIEEPMNALLRSHNAKAAMQNTENTLTLAELKNLFSQDGDDGS